MKCLKGTYEIIQGNLEVYHRFPGGISFVALGYFIGFLEIFHRFH